MISPAQQLLEKLLLKQQSPEATTPSPLILFQYSLHVSLRETAATRSSSTTSSTTARTRVQQQQQIQNAKVQAEADLYRRAQLRNPNENARRATWGGPLWVQYLTEELMRINQGGTVWVSTTTRPIPNWMPSNVSIEDANSFYEAMWEEEEEDSGAQSQQHPLAVLLDRIRARINDDKSTTCTPIILESLTPLVQLYGFASAFHWIHQLLALPNTLLLLPLLTETLMPNQHQQLEDLAHTALWLSNHTGQVDLHVLRRGIREQDSTVREIWEFSLQPFENAFSLVVGKSVEEEEEPSAEPDAVNLLEAMNPALNPEAQPTQPQQQSPAPVVTKPNKKITLKMEDDNRPPVAAAPSNNSTSSAPRIFLQDDDPEFEDYDEEDPDDDLDI